MLLNQKYYRELWDKYSEIQSVSANPNDKFSALSLKMILDHCRKRKPIHINFQNNQNVLDSVSGRLFVELSNEIFCNAAKFPPLNNGDRIKRKKSIGISKPISEFEIIRMVKQSPLMYKLRSIKGALEFDQSYDDLIIKFIPVTQNTHSQTTKGYTSYFENLNRGLDVHGFTPTYFDRKSVFIGPKAFYDSLDVKNKIPITYFPNPHVEGNIHETKSIPALPDSIMYFASKYEVCYEQILKQDKKIDTLVLCDTNEDKIEQIVQDRARYGFNLIVLTNTNEPSKYSQIPCWNWFKEEIEMVNSL